MEINLKSNKNEKQVSDRLKSNRYCLKCMNVVAIVYLVAWILNVLNIFIVDQTLMNTGFLGSLFFLTAGHLIKSLLGLDRKISSYLIMALLIGMLSYANIKMSYHATLFMVLPLICSVLYYDNLFTIYTFVLTAIGISGSVVGGFYFGLCDANMLLLTTTTTRKFAAEVAAGNIIYNDSVTSLLLYYAVPRCMALVAFTSILNYIKADIQEKTRKEMESRHMAEEAHYASQAKSTFLANMSHEIRTPINAVLGLDTMIIRESTESHIREYAQDIQNAGQSLLNLINDILDFSKIESGKMEIVDTEYHFGKLLHDIQTMISYKAESKDLQLKTVIDEKLPSVLYGDEVRIKQILINLLNNAVKYTEKGSVTLEVSGETADDEVVLHFHVKDTGIGIREEDMPKLFAKFERIEESRNRNIEGTGLGLSITSNLLLLMGSTLEVESVYQEGSDFHFDLKQRIMKDEPIGNPEEKKQETKEESVYKESFTAPDARVLVVDDNAINRKVFRMLLKKTLVQVDEAESGMQSIEMGAATKYDIIFMDQMMPEMDGTEAFHRMRETHGYLNGSTPVIILTANAISGAREEYLAEGFDEYLSKPIVQDELEAVLRGFLPRELMKLS